MDTTYYLFGTVQLKKDGTYYYESAIVDDEIEIGTYVVGEGNQIYFTCPMGYSMLGAYTFFYDEVADVINVSVDGDGIALTRTDIDLSAKVKGSGADKNASTEEPEWDCALTPNWTTGNEKIELYSIKIPTDWVDNYDAVASADNWNGSDVYSFTFYCTAAQENGGEYFGRLFTVRLFDSNVDYEQYVAEYRYLGTLKGSDGKVFNLVIDFPTDVQFTPNTEEIYDEMMNYVDAMIKSILPGKGVFYVLAS